MLCATLVFCLAVDIFAIVDVDVGFGAAVEIYTGGADDIIGFDVIANIGVDAAVALGANDGVGADIVSIFGIVLCFVFVLRSPLISVSDIPEDSCEHADSDDDTRSS